MSLWRLASHPTRRTSSSSSRADRSESGGSRKLRPGLASLQLAERRHEEARVAELRAMSADEVFRNDAEAEMYLSEPNLELHPRRQLLRSRNAFNDARDKAKSWTREIHAADNVLGKLEEEMAALENEKARTEALKKKWREMEELGFLVQEMDLVQKESGKGQDATSSDEVEIVSVKRIQSHTSWAAEEDVKNLRSLHLRDSLELSDRRIEMKRIFFGRKLKRWTPMPEPEMMELETGIPRVNLMPNFTAEEEDLYVGAMSGRENVPMFERFKQVIYGQQMTDLADRTWLNDAVINQYLSLLRARSMEMLEALTGPKLACYFHYTLFYTKLLEGGSYDYDRVKKWTKRGIRKCDLFTQDMVFFPINSDNTHWTLCVAYIKEKRIEYLDSMGGPGTQVMRNLLRYLRDEMQDKLQQSLHVDEWELVSRGTSVPQQNNTSDCGVFVCVFCNHISFGQELDFGPENISYFRKRIAVDLMKGRASFEL